jgi:hypothetical protein
MNDFIILNLLKDYLICCSILLILAMIKKLILLLIAFFFSVGLALFIHYNNDHVESETLIENSIGKSGEKITVTRHICKERFSF